MGKVNLSLQNLIALKSSIHKKNLFKKQPKSKNLAGPSLSIYKSSGIEFDEVREYQMGDEMRSIDWRVTAKKGKLHTKIYREEQDKSILFGCDLHSGMYFGTQKCFKSVLAMRLVSLLAWEAESKGDRVGGVIGYDNDLGKKNALVELKPRHRNRGILPLLSCLVKCQPKAHGELVAGRMDEMLESLAGLSKKGAHIVLVSDFSEIGDRFELNLRKLKMHNELKVLFVFDKFEKSLINLGELKLGTKKELVHINTAHKTTQKSWRDDFDNRVERIRTACHQTNAPFFLCCTSDEALNQF